MKKYVVVACVVAIVGWGVGGVIDKVALNTMSGMSPLTAQFFRFSVATVALWICGLFTGFYGEVRRLSRRAWLYIVLSGFFGVGVGGATYLYAVQLGEVSKVAVFSSGYPVLTVFLAVPFLGEKLTWNKVVGTLMVVGGLMILSLSGAA